MKNHPFEETALKRKINSLENVLRSEASQTKEMKFPKWEEVSKRTVVFVDFHEKQKKQRENMEWFFASFGIAGSILAASLFFSVWIARPFTEETKVATSPTPEAQVIIPEEPIPRAFKVTSVRGKIALSRAGVSIPVGLETELRAGDKLEVGKKSEIDLEMEDLVFFKVSENSVAELVTNEKTSKKSITEVRLESGLLLFHLAKLQKDATFRIKSGIWDTEVRGTTFSLSYSEKSGQKVSVIDGSVAVRNREEVGLEEVVTEKQAAIFSPEKPPEIATISKSDLKSLSKLQKEVETRKEGNLFQEFKRWELVRLEDGTEVRGVILGQTETELQVKTIDGEVQIPISKVLETEKIR